MCIACVEKMDGCSCFAYENNCSFRIIVYSVSASVGGSKACHRQRARSSSVLLHVGLVLVRGIYNMCMKDVYRLCCCIVVCCTAVLWLRSIG